MNLLDLYNADFIESAKEADALTVENAERLQTMCKALNQEVDLMLNNIKDLTSALAVVSSGYGLTNREDRFCIYSVVNSAKNLEAMIDKIGEIVEILEKPVIESAKGAA